MVAVHQTIMNHLSMKSVYSEAYGNVYYLAWTLANEPLKEHLEECCIQDVMFRLAICFTISCYFSIGNFLQCVVEVNQVLKLIKFLELL